VPKEEGESVRKKLLEMGILNTRLKIRVEEGFLLLPITEGSSVDGMEVIEEDFKELPPQVTDYREVARIPKELRDLLPTSFDVIGDIAILKLPEQLAPHATEIGRALMSTFPQLRSVLLDRGVEGEFRVRNLSLIAGDPDTETIHTEYGIRLRVDPSKVYFNPRLAGERRRVASMVEEGETVVDMFAGVGPFSIMISRHSMARQIFAIDLNPDAVRYLRENALLNRAGNVTAIEGDARQILDSLPPADRIIMNLPHSAHEFLGKAAAKLRSGGTIHLYLVSERNQIEGRVRRLLSELEAMGTRLIVASIRQLKTYSPTMGVYAIDLVRC